MPSDKDKQQKKKKIIRRTIIASVILVFFIISSFYTTLTSAQEKIQIFELDLTDSIEVAKASYELGIKFRFDKLFLISCKNEAIQELLSSGSNMADQIVKLFANKNINFYEEASYDFTGLQYTQAEILDYHVVVRVFGTYEMKIPTRNKEVKKIDQNIYLKKEGGDYFFCGSVEND